MRIEIDSAEVSEKTINNARGPWVIRSQRAYADQGRRYPAEIVIRLRDGQAPYLPGVYDLDLLASVYVDRKYGRLALSEELVLVPVKAARAASAA